MSLNLKISGKNDAENDKNGKGKATPKQKSKKPKKINKALLITIEIIIAIGVLMVLATGVLLWRIHQKPLEVAFINDTVQSFLDTNYPEFNIETGQLFLHWDHFEKPIQIFATKVRIQNKSNLYSIDANKLGAGLSWQSILKRKPIVNYLSLDQPIAKVSHEVLNTKLFSLDLQKDDQDQSNKHIEKLLSALNNNQSIENTSNELYHLDSIDIMNGSIHFLYDKTDQKPFEIQQLNLSGFKDKQGVHFQTYLEINKTVNTVVNAEALIPWHFDKNIKGRIHVSNLDFETLSSWTENKEKIPQIEGRFNIAVSQAELNRNGVPLKLNATLFSKKGRIKDQKIYPDGIPYQELEIKADYNQSKHSLNITGANLVLNDMPIQITGAVNNVLNAPEQLGGRVVVNVPEITHEQLKSIWPAYKENSASHRWLIQKITGYTFKNYSAAFDWKTSSDNESPIQNLTMKADFKDAKIDYRAPLFHIENANGRIQYDQVKQTLDVYVDKGRVNKMDVGKGHVHLDNIKNTNKAKSIIKLSLDGPLSSVFSYLKQKPISINPKFDTTKIKGNAAMDMTLVMGIKSNMTFNDIDTKITGIMTDVKIPDVINGITMTASMLNADINNKKLEVAGNAYLNGANAKLSYKQNLSPKGQRSNREIHVNVKSSEALRKSLKVDLSPYVSGGIPVDAIYVDAGDHAANININADLTAAYINIPELKYTKKSGQKAQMQANVGLVEDKVKSINEIMLTAPDINVSGATINLDRVGKITSGAFPQFVFDQTTSNVTFHNQDDLIALQIKTDVFDLEQWKLDPKSQGSQLAKSLNIKLETPLLKTAQGQFIKNVQSFTIIGKNRTIKQLELDAIAGEGSLYIRYKPDATGKQVFQLQADDAGAALKAFNIYTKIKGGVLVAKGSARQSSDHQFGNVLVGKAQLQKFQIVKAPSLAKLLSAMSLSGVLNVLNNEGLEFSRLESDIEWMYTPQGSVIKFNKGKTSGNSVGFTFAGILNTLNKSIDLSGTIVPLTGVNKLVSDIPLVGTILSGGSDSIFAATYTMEGSYKEPKIIINPLAALTPGILRQVLFE